VSGVVGRRVRGPNPRLAYGLTLPGLAICVAVAALFPHAALSEPLTVALALCAICASTAYVPLEGKLLVDASFVPLMLALAFLGPTPAFCIVVASELGAWFIQRYRAVVVPVNVFAVGSIALAGAAAFGALDLEPGLLFYVALAAVGILTLLVNDVLITSLIGILDGAPIRSRLAEHTKLIPALAINVALAVAAANIYAHTGLEAIVFVCGLIVAFNYMVRQTLLAREHARRVEKLASGRARLVMQTLDAEERQRRALAESLHDGTLQTLLSAGQDLEDASDGDTDALLRTRRAVAQTIQELRATVFDLHPTALEKAGLAAVLEKIVDQASRRAGFDTVLSVSAEAEGADDRLVVSIARELVANATKHSGATRLTLDVSCDDDAIFLHVRDDGVGFDAAVRETAIANGHIGLASCSERCEARRGSLIIETARGQGTAITAVIRGRNDPDTPGRGPMNLTSVRED